MQNKSSLNMSDTIKHNQERKRRKPQRSKQLSGFLIDALKSGVILKGETKVFEER